MNLLNSNGCGVVDPPGYMALISVAADEYPYSCANQLHHPAQFHEGVDLREHLTRFSA